jgi:hypothetical protein
MSTITHSSAKWMRIPLGILLGLVGAAIVLAVVDPRTATPVASPPTVLSDCDGAIDEIVIHYVTGAGDIVGRAYRDFLQQLPGDVVVQVVCPDRVAFDDLVTRVGSTDCRLEAVVVAHPITPWSRDRWLALARDDVGNTTLLCPRSEKSEEIWPHRAGDAKVGRDLANALTPRVASVRSSLFFDGGDFVTDKKRVFATPDVLLRNIQHTVHTRDELQMRLERVLNRDVTLLEDAPPYHAGMFMMAAGENTLLVGDPSAARRILGNVNTNSLFSPTEADFSAETIAQFEAVAKQGQEAGYHVDRIPVVPGRDGRTYMTYVNVIIDQRGDERVVYMPVYDGVAQLNRAAAETWRSIGYEVREVNCTDSYRHFGSLRCLVNIVSRKP